MNKTIYLKCGAHSKVNESRVFLKDVAELYCEEKAIEHKAKTMLVAKLKKP